VGIQQIGIGVSDAREAFRWYRQNLGMDIPVFEEAAEARLMVRYTGGRVHARHAILALNLKGGGGLEIWQFTSRTPAPPARAPLLGDLGILCPRIKSSNVSQSFAELRGRGVAVLGQVQPDPAGKPHFFLHDPYGNLVQVVEGSDWFGKGVRRNGGVSGCLLGVSDIDRARVLYSDVLGYDEVVYDREGVFADLAGVPGGEATVRRVLLTHRLARRGSFSRLLGPSQIELVQAKDRTPRRVFADRFWGDLGFIHLCFDVTGMDELQAELAAKGFPITIDSNTSFDMGEAAGRFAYVEDPDGTLVEMVETHKIPIWKKLSWYLDLRRRQKDEPIPGWMLSFLALGRVRD
jgi:catechol 2,3-dioxygenase-like lactoylglutathione lyase family enzyme